MIYDLFPFLVKKTTLIEIGTPFAPQSSPDVLDIRHGGGARIGRIHAKTKAHRPDIIVLTEFPRKSPGFCLRDALSTDGLIFQATSLPPPKKNGVLIAARAVQTMR